MNDKLFRKQIYQVAVGALLHDIGKFLQRAGVSLGEQSRGMESVICPTGKSSSHYTHRHVLYTNHFMEAYYNSICPEGFNSSEIANLASFHHKPGADPLNVIIQQADWASSGSDRTGREQSREDESKPYFKRQKLKSIFSSIALNSEIKDIIPKYYTLGELDPANHILVPKDGEKLEKDEYRDLFDEFETLITSVETSNWKLHLESLVQLMKQYTWCIPSDTTSEPDVPLFDHCYTTAAIASALYAWHHEKDNLNDEKCIIDNKTNKLMFLVGDLSGIQKYLFDLNQSGGKSVSKILRGRSFMLSMLSLAASEYILDELGLPPVCKVIDAGGQFKLILPHTEATLECIEKVREKFDRYCLETFKGELTINLALSNPLSLGDFTQENYKRIRDEVGHKVQREKLRSLSGALREESSWQFDHLYAELAENRDCPHCGKEPAERDAEGIGTEEARGPGPLCAWARKMGQKLPNAKFVVLEKIAEGGGESFFGCLRPRLLQEAPSGENILYMAAFGENEGRVYPHLDISNYLPVYNQEEAEKACNDSDTDNEQEYRKGMPKTFQHIAEMSEGTQMLGVYKADLDNLGVIFSEGLGGKVSLSREATLSRMFNFFFTRYLSHFLEVKFPNTYTLFSGGDDLCLIGPWNQIIDAARAYNDELGRFVGSNPDITISAGIECIHSRFPAGRAVERAEKLLEISKDSGRNRLTLFGHTMEWGDQLNGYLDYSDKLLDHLKDNKITRGFVYRLLNYYREYRKYKEGEFEGLLYLPHLKYDLARNTPKEEKNNKEYLSELRGSRVDVDMLFEHLPISVFITLYKIRNNKDKKGAKV